MGKDTYSNQLNLEDHDEVVEIPYEKIKKLRKRKPKHLKLEE